MNKLASLKNKNILFLQGPMGMFFKKLDRSFRLKGAHTFRIGFNAGDQFFSYKDNYTAFRERPEEWPKFIEDFLQKHQIEKIFLFGDCRYYQTVARQVSYRLKIDVFVFEEGYLRPHYITMEKFGVNGFSSLSRDPKFYKSLKVKNTPEPKHAHASKTKMVISAIIYYAMANILQFRYPYYRHHRDFSALQEFFHGVRSAWRKIVYMFSEKKYMKIIEEDIAKKYYFVPLQTHNDFQILQHSSYRSIEKFIIEVLESFAHHAPKETFLVFKHHPVDRGRKNYNAFILQQAKLLRIEERVFSFHDVYLPTCLKNAKATITINSTVGLTSIAYDLPTLTMGDAVYDIDGLTNHGKSLKKFWQQHKKPNEVLYQKYRQYLISNTQLNGSFYGKMPKELV